MRKLTYLFGLISLLLVALAFSSIPITHAQTANAMNVTNSITGNMIIPSNVIIKPALNLSTTHYTSYGMAVAACAVCSKNVTNTITAYGTVPATAAGTNVYYSYKVNNTVYVYNVSVAKNPSYICLNLTSALGTWSYCNPGSYIISMSNFNNHFGLFGPSSVTMTAKLSSSLISGNKVTYSGKVQYGSNVIPLSSSGTGYSNTITFTYYPNEPLNITLDGGGNANYSNDDPSVTVPSGLSGVTTYYQSANVIQWNGQQQFTSAPGNGNWLSGNEYTFNGMSGVVIPLWAESSAIAWTANTPATNDLYIGYTSISLWGNTLAQVGEAPQLSGSYGQYDNGATVFPTLYTGFPSTTTPSGWTNSGGTISNGASLTSSSQYITTSSTYGLVSTQILDIYGSIPTASQNNDWYMGYTDDAVNYGAIGGSLVINHGWGSPAGSILLALSGTPGTIAQTDYTQAAYEVFTIYYPSSTTASSWQNYADKYTVTSSGGVASYIGLMSDNAGPQGTEYMQWVRIRVYPPGGNMPTVTYGAVQSASTPSPITGVTLSTTPSNPFSAGKNSQITLSSSWSGGVANYNALYTIIYTGNSAVYQKINANGISGTSNVMIWTPTTANTFKANVIITDTNTIVNTGNSVYTGTMTIINGVTVTTSPSTQTIDQGQTGTILGTTSGTAPYTWQWLATTSGGSTWTNINGNNILGSGTANGQARSQNAIWTTNILTTTGTFGFELQAFDSTPSNAIATNANIIVNAAQVANVLLESNTAIEIGQSSTLTAGATLGTPGYTFNWFNGGTCSGTSFASGVTTSVSPITTNTYSFNSVDSATTKNVICSSSNTINVYTAPTAGTPIPSNILLDLGQSVTYNTLISNGHGTFTVNLINGGTVVNTLTGQASGIRTFGANIPAQGSQTFSVSAYDNGVTTPYLFTSGTNVIVVSATLVASSPTESNSIIDLGQSTTLTAQPSLGVTPYTAYQWYTKSGVTAPTCTSANAISGATLSTYSISPTTTNSYAYKVTDSATTAYSQCSSGNTVTEYTNPTTSLTTSGSNSIVDIGQVTRLSLTITNGDGSFTLAWSSSLGTSIAGCPTSEATAGTYTCVVTPGTAGTDTYSVHVTDNGPTTHYVVSPDASVGVTVRSTPSLSALAPSNILLDLGQSVTYNVLLTSPSGGSSFTVNLINGGVVSSLTGQSAGTLTFASNIPAIGSQTFYIAANDLTPTTPFPFSSSTNAIYVNSALLANAITPTSPQILVGVGTILTANPAAGSPSYSYQWYSGTSASCGSDTLIPGATLSTYNAVINGLANVNYCYVVTDSATTPQSATSATDLVSAIYPVYLQNSTSTAAITFPTGTGLPSCTNNLVGGICAGSVTYTTNTALSSDLRVFGSITVNSGQTLTTNGFSIYATKACTWTGATVTGGSAMMGVGASVSTSFAGSGGGGSTGGGTTGTAGGNTQAAGGGYPSGVGSTPSAMTPNTANIIGWFNSGWKTILTSASGGWGQGTSTNGGVGGSGVYGGYIQCGSINEGTINGAGIAGTTGGSGSTGGGSGGSAWLLVYQTSYTGGTNTITGGSGGGAGGNGKVVAYQSANAPISVIPQYYPLRLYTSSTNSSVTFSLSQTFNNVITSLQSSLLNINYTLPSNGVSGSYSFNVVETAGATSFSTLIPLQVNMTDINSVAYNSPVIQYFSNLACPTFTAIPNTYSIYSDMPSNQHNSNQTGGVCGAIFSNANRSFVPQYTLNYNHFSSFIANSLDNPAISNLTQATFNVIASDTVPSAPITREIINVSSYDQQTFSPLVASTGSSLYLLFNNYFITPSITPFSSNNFGIYMPLSNFQNPGVFIGNGTTLSSASSYFTSINNYCPATEQNGQFASWNPYLVDSSGQIYEFQTYQGSGYGAIGYYMDVLSPNPNGVSTQVQQYRITAVPFADPLSQTQEYQFAFYSAGCQSLAYTSALSTWFSPITLTIPNNIIIPSIPVLNANMICSTVSPTVENIKGVTSTSSVYKWNIKELNTTNLLGINTTLNQVNLTGLSFNYNFTMPANTEVAFQVVAYWGATNSISQIVGSCVPGLTVHNNPAYAAGGLIVIFLVLTFAFLGKGDPKLTLIMTLAALFLGTATAMINMPSIVFYGIAAAIFVTIYLMETDRV